MIDKTKNDLKINLPELQNMFVEFLKVSDNFQYKLDRKYKEILKRNRFLIKFLRILMILRIFIRG